MPLRGRELGREEVRGGVRRCGLDELENSVDQGRWEHSGLTWRVIEKHVNQSLGGKRSLDF